MQKWIALVACLAIDGAAVGRVVAQTQSLRTTHVISGHGAGYLGVGVEDIDEDRAKALRLPETRGVEIKGVEDGSPAAKSGLNKGDVVLEYNGQRVEGTDQFMRLVRETPAGHKVTMQIVRNGAQQTVTAVVSARNGNFTFVSPGMPDMPGMPAMPAMPAVPAVPAMPAIPGFPRSQFYRGQESVVGIEAEPLSGQLADFFGVKSGVLVRSVARNSAAEKGGLKAGDVVVKVNGARVTTPRDVLSQARGLDGKRAVPFVVMRNHHEMTLQVTLGDSAGDSGEDL